MPGHRSLLPALAASAAIIAGLVPAPATAAAPAVVPPVASVEEDDPLRVSIDSLNPSVVPTSGNVTITGTITNVSTETWTGINVYPVLPPDTGLPITTTAELDAAAQAAADLVIGERELSVVYQVDELAPEAVASYRLRIPHRLLPTTEGVHWLGVHALGANAVGRDDFNDGKARTFLPLVTGRKKVETALVLQLRGPIQYTSEGRIDQPDRWASALATGGRLRSVVETGAAAGDRDVTWLVDPAVITSVNALLDGNPTPAAPARDPPTEEEPAEDDTEDDTEDGEATPSASPSPSLSPTSEALTDPRDPAALAAVGVQAQDWLGRLQTALEGRELLALPYGDVDASAASHLRPQTLVDAQTLSATVMAGLGLPAAPAMGSPSGFLRPDAIRAASPETTLLLTSEAAGSDAPTVADVEGHRVVLASAGAVSGGPGPDDPLATVAVRQRILGEAAVRVLGEGREPLVVTVPTDWSPSDAAGFFSGLDVGFVDLVPLSEATDAGAEPLDADDLLYPVFQQDYELDAENFTAAEELVVSGTTLQGILAERPSVADAVAREANTSVSYWQRARVNDARAAAARSRAWIEGRLGRVTIDGPPSVTLASATGRFPATIRNGLDEPVTVRVGATTTSGLAVEVPGAAMTLDPGESTRLRLSATTTGVGAHSVRLYVASPDGTPLGAATQLPIRTSEISRIIWIVIVAGGGLLFGAIALRLVRRVRRASADG